MTPNKEEAAEPVAWVSRSTLNTLNNNDTSYFCGIQAALWRDEHTEGKRHSKRVALFTAPPQPSGEVERMREALEPFAKLGALFLDPDNQATKGDDRPVWGYNSIDLTYGDFRRAFAALNGGESNG